MHAVLFDIDGTLIRRTPGRSGASPKRQAIIDSIKDIWGRDGADYHLIDFEGMTDLQILGGTAELVGIERTDFEEKFHLLEQQLRSRYLQLMEAAGEGEFESLAGAREIIELLQQRRVRLGLATGNLKWAAQIKLASAGLGGLITEGGFGDTGADRADIVAAAIGSVAAGADKVALIGDTPRDIIAAKANKITAVAVATGAFDADALAEYEPDLILNGLDEYAKLFELIEL